MMNLLICIDDTDNLDSPGTGHLASMLVEQLEERGWGQGSYITRHQLLVHPDIPYTSHNSAMCFTASLHDNCPPERLIEHAGNFLREQSAPGSDPGLCVANAELISDIEPLVDFGTAAKQRVVSKTEAYALADRLGIHLSEHGGTGQGVVGALAGVGLRLGGNDGRLKGQLELGDPGERQSVFQLLSHPLIELVRALDGSQPLANELVELGEKIKTVLLGGKSVLLLEPTDIPEVPWRTCSRKLLRNY